MSRRSSRRPRPARRSRRQQRQRSQNIKGLLLLAVVGALFGGGFYWLFTASASKPQIDATTLCPTDRPPSSVTAVLVDASDPVSALQAAAIRNELHAVKADLPRYAAFELYTVGDTSAATLAPRFKACNPGSPDQIDAWTEGVKVAAQRWKEGFEAPLEQALADSLPQGEAPTSPIIESIQSVAVTAFKAPGLDGVPKRLVVVSDMLQNTKQLTHYKGAIDWEGKRGTATAASLSADLRGVDVEILYVRRSEAVRLQGRDHVLFWQDYFSDQGARVTRVYSISG